MPAVKPVRKGPRLPVRFADLARQMPPQAISDDVQYEIVLERIDRLMAGGKLTAGQSLYLETLVQLVQAYEATHHAVDTCGVGGLALLKHLLAENDLNATDLAGLLGIHASMGSKILHGERSLTVGHVKKLAARFHVNPAALIE